MGQRFEQIPHGRRYTDGKKHIKIRFTSQVFREMQIKTTIYYNTPIGMAKSKTLTTNAGEDVEQQKLSFIAGGNAK